MSQEEIDSLLNTMANEPPEAPPAGGKPPAGKPPAPPGGGPPTGMPPTGPTDDLAFPRDIDVARDVEKSSKLDKLVTLGAENMLSGPRTLATNVTGNVIMTANRPLLNLVSGRPRDAASDVAAMMRNTGLGAANAAHAFVTGERTRSQAGQVGKFDVREDAFPGKKGMFIIPALRAIGATDEFFRTINYKGAEAVGRRRGLMGSELARFASKASNEAVYESDPSSVAKALINLRGKINDPSLKSKAAGAFFQMAVPFARIPDTIIRKGIGLTVDPVVKPLEGAYHLGAAAVNKARGAGKGTSKVHLQEAHADNERRCQSDRKHFLSAGSGQHCEAGTGRSSR
jgi:hypothetical protein